MITLPIVVFIGLMAQPRLTHALAKDGLLPPLFGDVDSRGNIAKGSFIAGVVMTIIAFFVPFTYLDDLISSGILVAFCMTNCSVILMQHENPPPVSNHDHDLSYTKWLPHKCLSLERLLWLFNAFCFVAGKSINNLDSYWGIAGFALSGMIMIWIGLKISLTCPKSKVYGGRSRTTFSADRQPSPYLARQSEEFVRDMCNGNGDECFRTPCVPLIPLLAVCINWYLLAQLETLGLFLLCIYLGTAVLFYFCYGANNSVGNQTGWIINEEDNTIEAGDTDDNKSMFTSEIEKKGYEDEALLFLNGRIAA